MVSRTSSKKQHLTHNEVVAELARKVHKIWEAADCCPAPRQVIARLFQKDIWEQYLFLRREKHLRGQEASTSLGKRSHKKDPSKKKLRYVQETYHYVYTYIYNMTRLGKIIIVQVLEGKIILHLILPVN